MNRLTILIYHRVLPEPDPLREGLIDHSCFSRQLDVIGMLFDVRPLSEAVDRLRECSLRRPTACITFDDGYADNEEIALPLLKRRGMPATFFIASGYLDGGCMWNDRVFEAMRGASGVEADLTAFGLGIYPLKNAVERGAAALDVLDKIKYLEQSARERMADALVAATGARLPKMMMTSEQVRSLHNSGMDIGGHTMTHPILARIDEEAARREILDGKRQLEEIIDSRIDTFAFPNGRPFTDYGPEHLKLVRDAGFRVAVSTSTGVALPSSDPLQLPRFMPWPRSKLRLGLELTRNALKRDFAVV